MNTALCLARWWLDFQTVEIGWAAERRPLWSDSRQGAVSAGDAPPILFLFLTKRECAAPGGREKIALGALRCSGPLRATGVGVSVQAPIWTDRRARYALLRFLWLLTRGEWCRPRRGGHRIELLLFSLPLTPPRRTRQRVAKRNARKEELVKYGFAAC